MPVENDGCRSLFIGEFCFCLIVVVAAVMRTWNNPPLPWSLSFELARRGWPIPHASQATSPCRNDTKKSNDITLQIQPFNAWESLLQRLSRIKRHVNGWLRGERRKKFTRFIPFAVAVHACFASLARYNEAFRQFGSMMHDAWHSLQLEEWNREKNSTQALNPL